MAWQVQHLLHRRLPIFSDSSFLSGEGEVASCRISVVAKAGAGSAASGVGGEIIGAADEGGPDLLFRSRAQLKLSIGCC